MLLISPRKSISHIIKSNENYHRTDVGSRGGIIILLSYVKLNSRTNLSNSLYLLRKINEDYH